MHTYDQSGDAAVRRQLESLAEAALDRAARGGAEQTEVAASQDVGLTVAARLGDIETLEYQADRGLGVTVYVNGSKGSASSADFLPMRWRGRSTRRSASRTRLCPIPAPVLPTRISSAKTHRRSRWISPGS